ncbi:MAG: hypothetical protein E6713_02920 [Sporomusaceae bacterium]|nr:hypothetical protein [Sporomusaceae bacterium]
MDEIVKINSTTRTTSDGLATCLGLTRPRIIQLANDGVLSKDENSKYTIADNIKRYLAFIGNAKGDVSYDNERMLHEKAKREFAELRLLERKKELHRTEDIELMVGGMITIFKRQMLGLPHKLAPRLAEKSVDDINELLTNEITAALTELAAFDVTELGEYDEDHTEDN